MVSIIVTSNPTLKRILVGKFDEEILIAVLEGQQLMELHLEEIDNESITGNIYLGRVENIVQGLEALFVNIGKSKNVFLRARDLMYCAFGKNDKDHQNQTKTIKMDKISKGEKLIIQVKKDSLGAKGPQGTTNVGIAGRSLVYMPFSRTIGVSRKIEDSGERKRLHDFVASIAKKEGVIVRTVARNADLSILAEELEQLKQTWTEIEKRFIRSKKPKELYAEPEILEQIMREKYDSSVDEVLTNSSELYKVLEGILKKFDQKPVKGKLRFIKEDIFEKYGVNTQVEQIYTRKVSLDCGGTLVIDRTEALTIIDINSAKNINNRCSRDMVFETNIQAAKEAARQIRLRNLSGIIIIDFIDMEEENDQLTVLKIFEEEVKKDKARISILGFTKLGLLEMTRKRTSPPLQDLIFERCPICYGEGFVLSPKRVLKMIEREMVQISSMEHISEIQLKVHPNLSGFLGKEWLDQAQKTSGKKVVIEFNRMDPNGYDIKFKK